MKKEREEAEVCFKDLCVKVYDDNAQMVNAIAVIGGMFLVVSTISKLI